MQRRSRSRMFLVGGRRPAHRARRVPDRPHRSARGASIASASTAGACAPPAVANGCNWNAPGRSEHPVNCVDWDQARAYCELDRQAPSHRAGVGEGRARDRWPASPWGDDGPSCDVAVMSGAEGAGCGEGARRRSPVAIAAAVPTACSTWRATSSSGPEACTHPAAKRACCAAGRGRTTRARSARRIAGRAAQPARSERRLSLRGGAIVADTRAR